LESILVVLIERLPFISIAVTDLGSSCVWEGGAKMHKRTNIAKPAMRPF
jgi:hypothetical protein